MSSSKKVGALLLCSSLLVVVFSAASEPVPGERGTIAGRVVDASTGAPVAEVVVTAIRKLPLADEVSALSNPAGFFEIPGLRGGTYKLRFEKELFKSYSRPNIVLGVDQQVRVDAELKYTGQECEDPEFECFPQGYAPQVVGGARVGEILKQVDGGWVGVVEAPVWNS